MGFKNPCQNHVGTVSEPCWEHGTGSGLSRPVPTQNHTDPFSFRPVPTRNHSTAAATSHTCLHHFQFMTRDFPVMGEILLGFCLHVVIWREILAVVRSRLTTADNLVHISSRYLTWARFRTRDLSLVLADSGEAAAGEEANRKRMIYHPHHHHHHHHHRCYHGS
jgi:hypothetical protein